jgi:hypothetical protein
MDQASLFTIYRDFDQLEGTTYHELLPGPYLEKCWNPGSLFIEDDQWCDYLLPVMTRCLPGYDCYEFLTYGRAEWVVVLDELEKLRQALSAITRPDQVESGLTLYSISARKRLGLNFPEGVNQLHCALGELTDWCSCALDERGCITILGL